MEFIPKREERKDVILDHGHPRRRRVRYAVEVEGFKVVRSELLKKVKQAPSGPAR